MMFGTEPTTEKQKAVLERITSLGIPEDDLLFSDENTLRYQYWNHLPVIVEEALTDILDPHWFDDDDGEDEEGGSIIRTLYLYQIK